MQVILLLSGRFQGAPRGKSIYLADLADLLFNICLGRFPEVKPPLLQDTVEGPQIKTRHVSFTQCEV